MAGARVCPERVPCCPPPLQKIYKKFYTPPKPTPERNFKLLGAPPPPKKKRSSAYTPEGVGRVGVYNNYRSPLELIAGADS